MAEYSRPTTPLPTLEEGAESPAMDQLASRFEKHDVDVTGRERLKLDFDDDDEDQDLKGLLDDDGDDEETQAAAAPGVPRQLVDPLVKDRKIDQKIVKKLPDELKLPVSDAWLYPPGTEGIYNDYRGRDRPDDETLRIPDGPSCLGRSNATITVRNSGHVVGSLEAATDQERPDIQCVRLQWIVHSQVPGLQLIISRRGKDDEGNQKGNVTVKIHANNIARGYRQDGSKKVDFDMLTSNDSKLLERLIDPKLKAKNLESVMAGLWETTLVLCDPDKVAPFGPKYRRPEFYGMTLEEIDETVAMAESLGWEVSDQRMAAGDWAIAYLATGTDISIYRGWQQHSDAENAFSNFYVFQKSAILDAAVNGNFPHWQRQAEKEKTTVNDRKFDLKNSTVPRHLAIRWRITTESDTVTKVAAEQWHGFEKLTSYPDPESKALSMRLSIERTRGFDIAALNETFEKKKGRLLGSFIQFPNKPNYYWVDVSLDNASEGGIFGENRKFRPAPFARLTMWVQDGPARGAKLQGTVQEDIWGRNPELCAMMFFKPAEGIASIPMGDWQILIELSDDPTSANRQNAAMCELASGLSVRTAGVDLAALVLRSAATVRDTGALANSLKDCPFAEQVWEETTERWGFNAKQQEAVDLSFRSQSGAEMIWGPPGTGKTYTQMGIAHGHVMVGRTSGATKRQILVCAPTHHAVDAAMDTFLGKIDVRKEGIKVCRFRGSVVHGGGQRKSQLTEQMAEDRAKGDNIPGTDGEASRVNDVIWEFCDAVGGSNKGDDHLWKYYFHVQRKDYIKEVLHGGGEQAGEAKYYFQQKQIASGKVSGATKEQKDKASQEMDGMEALWTMRYLQAVDILFCTNSSAAHETLDGPFKPVILISDEAALASLPDSATPMAQFKESLMFVLLAGDHKQQGPPVLSRGANECLNDGLVSLFRMLMEDKGVGDKVMLEQQRRMKPVFSRFVSKTWYQDKLQDHPSLLAKTALEVTLEQALDPAKPYWNGRLRLSVDISGPAAQHSEKGTSRSLCNPAEAKAVVEYIHYLVNFRPRLVKGQPLSGTPIRPKDIMVITPYSGQVSSVLSEILARKINRPGDTVQVGQATVDSQGVVQVVTSAGCQGQEAQIVILSLVRNSPKDVLDVGFIYNSNQLCVNFSRQKVHLCVFGNMGPWMQAGLDGRGFFGAEKSKGRWRKYQKFVAVVNDFREQGDIISEKHLRALVERKTLKPEDDIRPTLKARVIPTAPDLTALTLARPRPNAFRAFDQEKKAAGDKRKVHGLSDAGDMIKKPRGGPGEGQDPDEDTGMDG